MNTSTAISPQKASDIMEALIARGDLAQLSPDERAKYYVRVCESVGLNPMTQPLAYITLNGRLVLYAKKECTDQLRSIHDVSVVDLTERERDGVFTVIVKVTDKNGRTDMATGAVHIAGLRGESLANAVMKAETKAKRRATLSICGLGFLDESELPGAVPFSDHPPQRPRLAPRSAADALNDFANAPQAGGSAPEAGTPTSEHDAGGQSGAKAAPGDAAGVSTSDDPIEAAYRHGIQAKADGVSRRGMPGEYRGEDRSREAMAWQAGHDGKPKPEWATQ